MGVRNQRHRVSQTPPDGPGAISRLGTEVWDGQADLQGWRLQCLELLHQSEWHGFRRGLASNLNRLGVDDSVIQAILRHSNVAVTQRCYIKTTSQDAVLAMQRLSSRTAEIKSSVHLMDVDPDPVVQ
jgi:hypothetical protein